MRLALTSEWSSIGHPNHCSPSSCKGNANASERASYSHTVKIWNIIDQMAELMKKDPSQAVIR